MMATENSHINNSGIDNSGIYISGGKVTAGAMAAGDHAQATNISAAPAPASVDELRMQLADLIQELKAHPQHVDDGEQAVAVAEMAAREADKERPNRTSFLGLMQVLAGAVGSASSLATAVAALEHAAAALF